MGASESVNMKIPGGAGQALSAMLAPADTKKGIAGRENLSTLPAIVLLHIAMQATEVWGMGSPERSKFRKTSIQVPGT
ncbi:hypothetical protein ACFSHR_02285 [Azotobacter chroococcum]